VLKKDFQGSSNRTRSPRAVRLDRFRGAARQTSFGKLDQKFDKRELGGITFRLKQDIEEQGRPTGSSAKVTAICPISLKHPEPASNLWGHGTFGDILIRLIWEKKMTMRKKKNTMN
jgi:hypothetical protein